MGIRLTGMSEVTRNMEAIKRALDGEIAKLQFDPRVPEDVARAIRQIEMRIEIKVAPYLTSAGVREIAAELKEECRKAILEKADEARKNSPS